VPNLINELTNCVVGGLQMQANGTVSSQLRAATTDRSTYLAPEGDSPENAAQEAARVVKLHVREAQLLLQSLQLVERAPR
jgi:hypothetical protein